MDLTVLGRWGAWAPPGGACAGYLVRAGGTRLLVDCGTGVLERLQRVMDPGDVSAVVITHLHPDHVLDLYPLRLYLQLSGRRDQPMPLVAPPDAAEVLGALLDVQSRATFFRVFAHRPIEAVMTVGEATLRFAPMRHTIPAWAVRVEAEGATLAYSADAMASDDLVRLASGCDLLLCEATLAEGDADAAEATGHMTASSAGEIAARAGAASLLLTHFFPTVRPEDSLEAAQKVFPGRVAVAEEGTTYTVGGR